MKDSLVEGELIRIPAGCYKITNQETNSYGNVIFTKAKIPEGTIATFIARDTVKENAIREDKQDSEVKMLSFYVCAKVLLGGTELCHTLIPYHRDFYQ